MSQRGVDLDAYHTAHNGYWLVACLITSTVYIKGCKKNAFYIFVYYYFENYVTFEKKLKTKN